MDSKKFRVIRLWLNMTQEEFAKFLGISRSTVALIESGKRDVSPQIKAKIISKIEFDEDFFDFQELMLKISHFNNNKK